MHGLVCDQDSLCQTVSIFYITHEHDYVVIINIIVMINIALLFSFVTEVVE